MLMRLSGATVPCIASCAVINKPVYRCICTNMHKYSKGLEKSTRHCISKIIDVAQKPMTSKAINNPVYDSDFSNDYYTANSVLL